VGGVDIGFVGIKTCPTTAIPRPSEKKEGETGNLLTFGGGGGGCTKGSDGRGWDEPKKGGNPPKRGHERSFRSGGSRNTQQKRKSDGGTQRSR